MGRPRLPIPRDRQLNISLTALELETVFRRAAAAGMRPVDYGRARLLTGRVTVDRATGAAPHLDPLFRVELSRIGNNLNQIARQLHALRSPQPEGLGALVDELRRLLNSDGAR